MPLIGLNQGITTRFATAAPVSSSGLVRGRPIVQGGTIRSEIGTTLRGVTFALDGPGTDTQNYSLTRSNWQLFRDLKLNIVRLPFSLALENNSLSTMLPYMDQAVGHADATGMYVMFMLDQNYGVKNFDECFAVWPTIATRYKDRTNVIIETGNEWCWGANELSGGDLAGFADLYNQIHAAAPNTFVGLLNLSSVDNPDDAVNAMAEVRNIAGSANFNKAFIAHHSYGNNVFNSSMIQVIKNSFLGMMTETTHTDSPNDDPVGKIPGIDSLNYPWMVLNPRNGLVTEDVSPFGDAQDSLTDRIIPEWNANGFNWPQDTLTNNPGGVIIQRALPAGRLFAMTATNAPGAVATTQPGATPGRAFLVSSAVAKGTLVGTAGNLGLPKSISLNPANPGSIQQTSIGATVSWTTQIIPANLTAGVSWAIIMSNGTQRGGTTDLAKNNSSYTITAQLTATGDRVRVWETGNTAVNVDSGAVTVVAPTKTLTITPMSPGTIASGATVSTQIRAVNIPNITYGVVNANLQLSNGTTSVAMATAGQTRTVNIPYTQNGQFLRAWDTAVPAFKVDANPVTIQVIDPGSGASWFEDFSNNNPGKMSHVWGNSSNLSFSGGILRLEGINGGDPGQVACGVMEFPGGADQGHGYGYYEIRGRSSDFLGDGSGIAFLTWPADDVWPGGEEDMGEIGADGTFYMAHHWDDGGNDAYEIFVKRNHDPGAWHTYGMRLKRDFLEYFVDGQSIGSTTNNVIRVYGDGGGYTVNRVFGVMIRSHDVWLECDWCRYTAEGPT